MSSNSPVSAGKLLRLIAGGSIFAGVEGFNKSRGRELHEALGLVRDKRNLSSLRNLKLQPVS